MTTSALSRWKLRPGAVALWSVVGAALVLLVAGAFAEPPRAFSGLLAAALFGLSLALGAAFFIAIMGVAGARWWLPLRGVASALAGTLAVPAALLAFTLVTGLTVLYPWANGAASHLGHGKAAWLSAAPFLARAIGILAIWLGLVALLRSRIPALASGTKGRAPFGRACALFVVVLAPTISVGYWDWAMSLEPHWFSTMFGVYAFSGSFLGGIAAITVLAIALDRRGLLPQPLDDARLHDLGKLLFAFSMFWAYIWFCQYLLIWYANLPEEVPHYLVRMKGGWATVFWLNPILSFGIPFFALLSEGVKKRPAVLFQVSLVVLLGRWVDTWLLVAPPGEAAPGFPLYAISGAILVTLGMGVLFLRLHSGPSLKTASPGPETLMSGAAAAPRR